MINILGLEFDYYQIDFKFKNLKEEKKENISENGLNSEAIILKQEYIYELTFQFVSNTQFKALMTALKDTTEIELDTSNSNIDFSYIGNSGTVSFKKNNVSISLENTLFKVTVEISEVV